MPARQPPRGERRLWGRLEAAQSAGMLQQGLQRMRVAAGARLRHMRTQQMR